MGTQIDKDPFSGVSGITHTQSLTLTIPSPVYEEGKRGGSNMVLQPYSPRSPRHPNQGEERSPRSRKQSPNVQSPTKSISSQKSLTSPNSKGHRQLKQINYKTILKLPLEERWWYWRVTSRVGSTKTFWNKGPLIRNNPFIDNPKDSADSSTEERGGAGCQEPTMFDKKTGKKRHLFGMKAITFPEERDVIFLPQCEGNGWVDELLLKNGHLMFRPDDSHREGEGEGEGKGEGVEERVRNGRNSEGRGNGQCYDGVCRENSNEREDSFEDQNGEDLWIKSKKASGSTQEKDIVEEEGLPPITLKSKLAGLSAKIKGRAWGKWF